MNKLDEALGLFPSVIKCGEEWSSTCQSVLDGAKADLAALRASLAATPAVEETCFDCGVREPCDDDCPNHVEPATPAVGGEREAAIEECAKLIESGAGMADLIDQEELDQQAKYIRALAAQPASPLRVTGASDIVDEAACLIWSELCPDSVMGDDERPHYEAAAKAVLALASPLRGREIDELKESVCGAVARGWCSRANEDKEFDADLARSIFVEVWAEVAAALASLPILCDAQPEYLSGCQLRGPGECQKEGKCMSASCDHYGKTEYRARMTVLAQVDGIVYPEETTKKTSGLNDCNETTAKHAREEEISRGQR